MTHRRIVLDANVLIDAIFVPGSFSHQLLFTQAGSDLQPRFIVCKSVVDEVEQRLKQAEHRIGTDLRLFLTRVLYAKGFLVVDALSVGKSRMIGINRADSYLVDDAIALDADICTKDIGDIRGAAVLGLRVSTPRELLGLGMHTLSGGFYAGRTNGTWLFLGSLNDPVRSFPRSDSRVYLLDQPGIGGLFIDLQERELRFELDWGSIASVALPEDATALNVCLTYRSNQELIIQTGINGPERRVKIGSPTHEGTIGGVSIGHDREGKRHPNCCIRDCSSLSIYLPTRKARNNLLRGDASSSQLERLSVEDAFVMFAE